MANKPQQTTLTMYGIKNCDTIKKARRWLEDQGVAYHFHDYRADGLTNNGCAVSSRNWGGSRCSIPAAPPGASWMKRSATPAITPTPPSR